MGSSCRPLPVFSLVLLTISGWVSFPKPRLMWPDLTAGFLLVRMDPPKWVLRTLPCSELYQERQSSIQVTLWLPREPWNWLPIPKVFATSDCQDLLLKLFMIMMRNLLLARQKSSKKLTMTLFWSL